MGIGDEKKNLSAADRLAWEMAYRKLAGSLPAADVKKWLDCFQFTRGDRDQVVLVYEGKANLDEFAQSHHKQICDCISEALGYPVELEFQQKNARKEKETESNGLPKRKKEKPEKTGRSGWGKKLFLTIAVVCVMIAAVFATNVIRNQSFAIRFYQVASKKMEGNLRIVQLADMDGTEFGTGNSRLLERISLLKPDIVVLSGNILAKDGSRERVMELCRRLSEKSQVCYVFGPNEKAAGEEYAEMLESLGIYVIDDEMKSVKAGNNVLDVYGTAENTVSDQEAYENFVTENQDRIKLFVCYSQEIFETAKESITADFALCGGREGGKQDVAGTPLIVSGGLSNQTLFRFNDQPELVVVDVSRY